MTEKYNYRTVNRGFYWVNGKSRLKKNIGKSTKQGFSKVRKDLDGTQVFSLRGGFSEEEYDKKTKFLFLLFDVYFHRLLVKKYSFLACKTFCLFKEKKNKRC